MVSNKRLKPSNHRKSSDEGSDDNSSPAKKRKFYKSSPDDLKAAIAEANVQRSLYPDEIPEKILKRIKLFRIASKHRVPRSTLRRHFLAQFDPCSVLRAIGHPTVFTAAQETELVNTLIDRQLNGFPLTVEETRILAFKYAELLGTNHRFNTDERMAGWTWWAKFKNRHPELSLRVTENVSQARVLAMHEDRLAEHFNALEACLDRYHLKNQPEFIYNVDECGMSIVPSKRRKVVAKKGSRLVQSQTSKEKGSTTTMVAACNAAGTVMPPMLIYPIPRVTADYTEGLPEGSLCARSKNGWINNGLFLDFFDHFVKNLVRPAGQKVMLLSDGHASHRTPEVQAKALHHDVILFELPSHTSNHLQPLDVGVFKSFKTSFSSRCASYMNHHPGEVIDIEAFIDLFSKAYQRMAKPHNAVSGFRKAGVCPFDPSAINKQHSEVAKNMMGNDGPELRDRSSASPATQSPISHHSPPVHHNVPTLALQCPPSTPHCSTPPRNGEGGEHFDPLSAWGVLGPTTSTVPIQTNSTNDVAAPPAAAVSTATTYTTLVAMAPQMHDSPTIAYSNNPVYDYDFVSGQVEESEGMPEQDGPPMSLVDLLPSYDAHSQSAKLAYGRLRKQRGHLNPTPEKEVPSKPGKITKAPAVVPKISKKLAEVTPKIPSGVPLPENNNCPICEVEFEENEECIRCMRCVFWCHEDCGKSTDTLFVCLECRRPVIMGLS